MCPRYLTAHARRLDLPSREALLATLLEQTPDPLAALDSQLCLLTCNAAYTELAHRLFGIALEPGMDLQVALREYPSALAWLHEQRRLAATGLQSCYRRLADGRIYEIRSAALPGDALSLHLRDVTERTLHLELSNQRLREKEERLGAALDAARTGTFRWDIVPDRLDCDDNLARLLGIASQPTRLQTLLARVHPDERSAVAAAIERSRTDGSELDEVFQLDTGTAARRWLHAKARCYRDITGRPAYITGACVDISELMQAEHELEEREASFRLLADSLPAIVWIRDPDIGLVFANRRWSEYTGLTMEATRNRGWEATVHPEDLPWVRERVHAVRLAGEPFEAEYRVRRHDGSFRWHLCRAVPMRDGGGRIRHWYGTAIDVTEQKLAEQRLITALESRDRFLSIASHELRTPLTSLSLHLQMLRRRVRPDQDLAPPVDELARALDLGNRQVQRLTRLVDDLLDISRIEAGRLEFHYEPVDLGQLAREAVEQFAGPLREAGCTLTLRVEEELGGHWDAGRLEQVLGNLLINCSKYAAGSAVELTVGRDGEYALLRVSDHGRGIPLEEQEKVFLRFERSSASAGPGGLGLGLYLVRQIVEAHGGRVDLTSAPGAGCSFAVRLPLGPSAAASSSRAM